MSEVSGGCELALKRTAKSKSPFYDFLRGNGKWRTVGGEEGRQTLTWRGGERERANDVQGAKNCCIDMITNQHEVTILGELSV